jgi:hypothetical protein
MYEASAPGIDRPVHQWIAFQAYNMLLKYKFNTTATKEISDYLPTLSTSEYYSPDFSTSGWYDFNRNEPYSKSTALIEGAWEEDNWETADILDHLRAGKLRFRFWIQNIGTDIAKEIKDIRFNITIGNNLPRTYPSIESPALSLNNLTVSGKIEFSADILITLEELKAIALEEPVVVTVTSFSYGIDQLAYQNAMGRDVLVEIDDGIEDGDESIDYFMTYVGRNETYFDVLKRLGTLTPVCDPFNLRNGGVVVKNTSSGSSCLGWMKPRRQAWLNDSTH